MSKLPPHFFRCPLLSDADTADLKAFAEQASIDSVRHARLHNGPIKWSIIEDDHDLQVLSGYDPAAPAGVLSYGSTTYLYASIDDVASLFRAETDEEYQTYRRQFAPDLLDGAPLYTLTSPTPANPQTDRPGYLHAFQLLQADFRGGINAAAALTGRGGSQRRAGTQLSSSAAATPTPRTLYTPKVPRFHKSASTTPTSARLPSSPLSFDFLNESIFQHSTGERSTGFSVDDDLDDLDSSFIFTPTQLHDAPRNSRQLQSQGQQDDRTLTDVPPWHQQQLVRYDPTKAQDPRHTDKVPPLLRDDLDHRNDIIPLVMSP
ncbi:hypothetical protein B5M09_011356 [Aphanomyces astaci]|uniref:Uncharacterized protein n=1 Tax=Aphanomyces astaci TaxID=112090 RepID=A0A425CXF5_APHAT|nr:hypothetical protein B5M09_011356 [Aphanomyces astaci]